MLKRLKWLFTCVCSVTRRVGRTRIYSCWLICHNISILIRCAQYLEFECSPSSEVCYLCCSRLPCPLATVTKATPKYYQKLHQYQCHGPILLILSHIDYFLCTVEQGTLGNSQMHNALFVQYLLLATEQAGSFFKSAALLYHLTHVYPFILTRFVAGKIFLWIFSWAFN